MAKVLGLFGSQADATDALDALTAANFGEVRTKVFGWGASDASPVAVAALPVNQATMPPGIIVYEAYRELDFDLDEEEEAYVTRQINDGAIIVVVETDDGHTAPVQELLEAHDARTLVE